MRRINTNNKATNLFGAGKHGWKNGVPGTADRPTNGQAEWFNAVQEELAGLIEGAGVALDEGNNNQLAALFGGLNLYDPNSAVPGTKNAKLTRWRNPIDDYDAVGDGVADDSDALEDAVLSGEPIDWLDATYRVTREIAAVAPGPIRWRSGGATIVMDSVAAVRSALRINVGPHVHRIEGEFTVDGNMKAFTGLALLNETGKNFPADYADFVGTGLRVRNCYRSSTAFTGGDGLWFKGGWRVVALANPSVRGVWLAAGAGVPGSQGVSGITLSGVIGATQADDYAPRYMFITDPEIVDVRSQDLTYTSDQDGIRFVGQRNQEGVSAPFETQLQVRGGVFINCFGRAVKSQAEFSTVQGARVTRNAGFTLGSGNEDFDFQEGNGTLLDTECHYTTYVPDKVVQFTTTRQDGKVVPYGSLDGLKVVVTGANPLPAVWGNAVTNGTGQIITVGKVQVHGPLTDMCTFNALNSGTGFHLLMSDIIGAPCNVFVRCGSGLGGGTIKATRCINTGAGDINFRETSSGNFRPLLSVSDSVGFVVDRRLINTDTPVGMVQRIASFVAADATTSGCFVPFGFVLDDGQIYDFPDSEASLSSCMVLISVGMSRQSQGVFGHDDNGVLALAAGTEFSVGTTAEPGSGSFRLWSTGTGLRISNRSGLTRSFTALMFG